MPYDLSLEELQAETCMVLPERDLMQNVALAVGGGNAGASVFSEATGTAVAIVVSPTP